ncbi:hemolysin family protein [Patescibacteria group bacterium]|nr:hemolysin family protein [Patescibacteria group bacterium]MBU1673740.1 hemolysin family protein [Patescibacteria group bacterium]MBU1963106.1 hemolysin family protein [Patescibacteria group bacterium]
MTTAIIVLIILILLSGFFSGVEIAFFSLRHSRVDVLEKQKIKSAFTIKKLKDNPDRLLITILIGNNLVNIGAASLATVVATEILGSIGAGVATGVMTFLILLFGEIIPKSFSQRHPVGVATRTAKLILFLEYLFLPISYLLSLLSKVVNKIFGADEGGEVDEEEVKAMAHMGAKTGGLEKGEEELINRIFLFNDITAEDVCVVKSEMVVLNVEQPIEQILNIIEQSGFSRFPVYQGRPGNIIGVLHAKEILDALSLQKNKDITKINIKDIITKPYFIPEGKKIDDLLHDMQSKQVHMAIVVDETGEVTGSVTLEDLIEELVGEILDESDVSESLIKRIDKRTIIADANTTVDHINKFFNVNLPMDDHQTIAGLVLEELGEIPQKGDELEINRVKIIVEEAEETRIKRVRLIKMI